MFYTVKEQKYKIHIGTGTLFFLRRIINVYQNGIYLDDILKSRCTPEACGVALAIQNLK